MNQNKALHNRIKKLEALKPNSMIFHVLYLHDNSERKKLQLGIDELVKLDREKIQDIQLISGTDLNELDRYLVYLFSDCAL